MRMPDHAHSFFHDWRGREVLRAAHLSSQRFRMRRATRANVGIRSLTYAPLWKSCATFIWSLTSTSEGIRADTGSTLIMSCSTCEGAAPIGHAACGHPASAREKGQTQEPDSHAFARCGVGAHGGRASPAEGCRRAQTARRDWRFCPATNRSAAAPATDSPAPCRRAPLARAP
eukprot:5175243-Prymnesium_polylepis.1